MKIVAKQHHKDRDIVELYDEDKLNLIAVVHMDFFCDLDDDESGEFYADMKAGREVELNLSKMEEI